MNTAQRIIKNTLSLLGSGVMAQLLGFVLVIYLARILSPEGFGMFCDRELDVIGRLRYSGAYSKTSANWILFVTVKSSRQYA